MAVPVSKLIEIVSATSRMDPEIVFRHWRALREADLVPKGKKGPGGGEAFVGSLEASTLLLSLQGDSARTAADYVSKLRKLKGSRLFAAYAVHPGDDQREVSEVTIAPAGTSFEVAVAQLIEFARTRNDKIAMFGHISIIEADSEIWGEIEMKHADGANKGRFPKEKSYPSIAYYTAKSENRKRAGVPPWFKPPSYGRTGWMTLGAILRVAKGLGKPETGTARLFRFEPTCTYKRAGRVASE